MHKRRAYRQTVFNMPGAVRGTAVLLLIFSAIKLCSALFSGGAARDMAEALILQEGVAEAIIMLETGAVIPDTEPKKTGTAAVPLSPSNVGDAPSGLTLQSVPKELRNVTGDMFSGTLSAENIAVKNYSAYDPDYTALLNSSFDLSAEEGEPLVLVIHTHSSEAYLQAEGETYEESDPYRTEDKDKSIIGVGDSLCDALEGYGVVCIHDRELYDYPSYTGAYGRSLESVERWLSQYPSIKLVFDVHRDAMEDNGGAPYKTAAQIDGETCAQIMLVAGTDSSGLEHPEWEENLKLALKLQYAMDEKYPALSRPINLSEYRYNQDVSPGALIIEIGTNGNTLSEAKRSAEYFAACAAEVIKG